MALTYRGQRHARANDGKLCHSLARRIPEAPVLPNDFWVYTKGYTDSFVEQLERAQSLVCSDLSSIAGSTGDRHWIAMAQALAGQDGLSVDEDDENFA